MSVEDEESPDLSHYFSIVHEILLDRDQLFIKTHLMPEAAAQAFQVYTDRIHHKSWENWEKDAQQAAEIFQNVMGFSIIALLEAYQAKAKELGLQD